MAAGDDRWSVARRTRQSRRRAGTVDVRPRHCPPCMRTMIGPTSRARPLPVLCAPRATPTLYLHGVPDGELWTPFLERTCGLAPDLPGSGTAPSAATSPPRSTATPRGWSASAASPTSTGQPRRCTTGRSRDRVARRAPERSSGSRDRCPSVRPPRGTARARAGGRRRSARSRWDGDCCGRSCAGSAAPRRPGAREPRPVRSARCLRLYRPSPPRAARRRGAPRHYRSPGARRRRRARPCILSRVRPTASPPTSATPTSSSFRRPRPLAGRSTSRS